MGLVRIRNPLSELRCGKEIRARAQKQTREREQRQREEPSGRGSRDPAVPMEAEAAEEAMDPCMRRSSAAAGSASFRKGKMARIRRQEAGGEDRLRRWGGGTGGVPQIGRRKQTLNRKPVGSLRKGVRRWQLSAENFRRIRIQSKLCSTLHFQKTDMPKLSSRSGGRREETWNFRSSCTGDMEST